MSVIRDRALRYQDRIGLDALPERVADLLRDPPPSTAWIASVPWQCVSLAIKDTVFPGAAGIDAYLSMLRDENARLFRSPLYRAILVLVSPRHLLRGAEKRFHTFHRGVSLVAEKDGDLAFQIRLTHPPGLYHPTTIRGIAAGLEAAVMAAGGTRVDTEQLSRTASEAAMRIHWH